MKEVKQAHGRRSVTLLAALFSAVLVLVLCAGIVFARPSLVPASIAEIREAVAQDGSAVVLVTLDDSQVIAGPAVFVKQGGAQNQRAVRQQQLKAQRVRNTQVREQVLQDINDDLEPTLVDDVTDMFAITGLLSYDEQAGSDADTDAPPLDVLNEYATSSGFSAEVTADGLDALLANDDVKSITLDRAYPVALAQSVPLIDATDAWNRSINGVSLRGDGVGICIIDTGIEYSHPAFANRIVDSRCFLSSGCPSANITDASDNDPNGHGTHVAGIAAANGTYVGVAPAANLVVVKACDSTGNCFLSAMTAGVDWCVNVSAAYNISVISLSISDTGHYETLDTCPYDSSFEDAVDSARALGITVTVAAGNSGGVRGIGWPSCIPSATSVGSTTKSDTLSGFQVGDLLDVLAPGSSITSPVRNGNYGAKSGTSMAAPHVAGAVALLWQNELLHNRTITPGSIEHMMRNQSGVLVANWTRIDVINVINDRNTNLSFNASTNTIRSASGSISFPSAIDSADIYRCVNISYNAIRVDSASCPQYNRSATLTLTGLPYARMPLVFRDGVLCTECNMTSFNNGSVIVDVGGFSTYTTTATASLTAWNSPSPPLPFQLFTVYANYTNTSNGKTLDVSAPGFGNVSCSVSRGQANDSAIVVPMTQDPGTLLFNATLSINATGTQGYNVSCNGTSVGLEDQTAVRLFSMLADNDVPFVTLQTPVNGTLTNASVVTFTFNTTDNSGYVKNCTLFIDGVNSSAVVAPLSGVNQTLNATIEDGNHTWAIRCVDGGNIGSLTNSWKIAVMRTNHVPVLQEAIANLTFQEDGLASVNLTPVFYDSDNDELSYSALAPSNLTVSISTANGTATATVRGQANTYGTYSLVFLANDSVSNASSNNITVSITPVDDPPVFSGELPSRNWDEDNDKVDTFDLRNYFRDVDNTTLLFTANGTTHISVVIDPVRHNVTLSPEANWSGVNVAQFSASDGRNRTYSNVITLTVNNETPASGGSGGGGGAGTSTCQNACPVPGPFGCAGPTVSLRCEYINGTACLGIVRINCSAQEICTEALCEPKPCVPEWRCGEWSACADATQTRVCTDNNNCSVAVNKPATQQYCNIPRPRLAPSLAVAEAPANAPIVAFAAPTTDTNLSGSCGNGNCTWSELCFKDCKARNVKGLLVLAALGGLVAVIIMHKKRSAPQSTPAASKT